ncbi:non-specific lipid transfer protein GPI-anchored 25 [Actinidia eriantha]|uniref:non-specific lipid transfer protein GPI-anchored 25 n=1 Tax=Actinidia eriantha TaxID=165200 RepID=UPI00258DE8AB|nr:non-specific lipid transfer protein GPI-anchored 25 [Actinidia eriantha]
MAFNSPIHLLTATIALLLTSAVAVATTSPAPAAAVSCTEEVVAFSPCLPFISSEPNNVSSWPSSQCCHVISLAFESGVADCLCYLSRRPLLIGFPLNSTRLFSLSSLCPLMDAGSKANGSLESLCSGLSTLPPLQGITGPEKTKRHHPGSDNSPPPMPNSPPDSADTSPATPSSSTTRPRSTHIPAVVSSAANRINNAGDWFSPGMIGFLGTIFNNLYCHIHH